MIGSLVHWFNGKGNTVKIRVFIALMAVYIIWGSTYLAMKTAVHTYPPYLMSGIRFFMAGIFFFLILFLFRRVNYPTIKQWINSAIIGALFFGGGTGLVGYAQISVSSSIASMAVAIIPIWVCILAMILKDYPSPKEFIGVVIGFIGIVVLNLSSQIMIDPIGGILLFLAPLLWSIGTILSRKLDLPTGAMRTVTQLITGGLVCLLVSVFIKEPWSMPQPEAYWSMLYLIIFGSLIAFTAYNYLLENSSPVLATSYAFVNPLIAALLGVLVGEIWSLQLSLALGLICFGVVFVVFGQEKYSSVERK
jgi:drug/metabolite transporter (DMT)-like permease